MYTFISSSGKRNSLQSSLFFAPVGETAINQPSSSSSEELEAELMVLCSSRSFAIETIYFWPRMIMDFIMWFNSKDLCCHLFRVSQKKSLW